MAKYADRVKETTTTTGTGTLSLGGALSGFQGFVAGHGDGEFVPSFAIVHTTANEWEVNSGTVTDASPDTLTRGTPHASSNSGSLVNLSAGTKHVFSTSSAYGENSAGKLFFARCASTANGTLATEWENGDTVDGQTLATGDIVLIKDQSTASENGLYQVNASGAPTRIAGMQAGDNASESAVFVREGSTNSASLWQCTTDGGSDVIGTNNLTFTSMTGSPSAHSSLSGLTSGDDHTQYALTDGTRDLTGGLLFSEISTPSTPATGKWALYPKTDGLYLLEDDGTEHGPFVTSSGGAPTTSQYVTLANDATLSNERVLAGSEGVTFTDGGAGGNVTGKLDVSGMTEETSVDAANDFIPVYDNSATAHRKVKPENLPSGQPFSTATAHFKDSTDTTKQVRVLADDITTGTTRTLNMPDQNVDLTPDTGTFAGASGSLGTGDTSDDVKQWNGSSWVNKQLDAGDIKSGQMAAARGGLGADTSAFATGSLAYFGGSNWAAIGPGTSGHVLTSNGSGSSPTFQAAASGSSATVFPILFHDTCTDTGSTHAESHTPDTDIEGNGYTDVSSSSWYITSGGTQLEMTANGANRQLQFDADYYNVILSCDITIGDSSSHSSAGYYLRYNSSNDYYNVRLWQNTNQLQLIRMNGGSDTTPSNPSFTVSTGTTYNLKVVTYNNSDDDVVIRVYVDGVLYIDYTDSSPAANVLTETTHALNSIQSGTLTTTNKFDNIILADGSPFAFGVGGDDDDAIHDDVSGEIAAITAKGSPTSSDYLLIEDAADSNSKKSITIGDLPTGDDTNAIHDDESGEIAALTEKGSPVSADLLIIEDSAASNAKKKVQIGNLPSGDNTLFGLTRTAVKTATYTAAVGDLVAIDASSFSGNVDFDFPGTIAAGDVWGYYLEQAHSDHMATINRDGNTIGGETAMWGSGPDIDEKYSLCLEGDCVIFMAISSSDAVCIYDGITPHVCTITKTSTQGSMTQNTWIEITMDTTIIDIGNLADTSNNRIQVRRPGLYDGTAFIKWNSVPDTTHCGVTVWQTDTSGAIGTDSLIMSMPANGKGATFDFRIPPSTQRFKAVADDHFTAYGAQSDATAGTVAGQAEPIYDNPRLNILEIR